MAARYKRVQLEDDSSIRSGDEAPTANILAQDQPLLPVDLYSGTCTLIRNKDLVRVPGGDHDTAIDYLLQENSQSSTACKFIFSIKNMTKHTLYHTKSEGGDSWPFSII